jgi:ABC-type multidrug transport system fused ATPase/permease subunit
MNFYSISLFVHVVGVIGFFATLVLEWMGQHMVRSATTKHQIFAWLGISSHAIRAGVLFTAIVLASGAYMMKTVWGHVSWIMASMGPMIPLTALALIVTGRRLNAIRRQITVENEASSTVAYRSLREPRLLISFWIRVAFAIGIVFLMTVKPDFYAAMFTIGVAAALGVASAVLMRGSAPTGR